MGRSRPWTLLAGLALVSPLLSLETDAGASVSVAVRIDQLVQSSTAALFVTPMTQSSQWENGRIVTYTSAHVDRAVAGASPGADLWLRTLGGEVGRVGQSVSGEAVLTVGRQSLLFVAPAWTLPTNDPTDTGTEIPGLFAVTERAQGQFPVVAGSDAHLHVAVSSAIGANLPPIGATSNAPFAADLLRGLAVDDAAKAVGQAWTSYRAP
jgi:hypothetical protein